MQSDKKRRMRNDGASFSTYYMYEFIVLNEIPDIIQKGKINFTVLKLSHYKNVDSLIYLRETQRQLLNKCIPFSKATG